MLPTPLFLLLFAPRCSSLLLLLIPFVLLILFALARLFFLAVLMSCSSLFSSLTPPLLPLLSYPSSLTLYSYSPLLLLFFSCFPSLFLLLFLSLHSPSTFPLLPYSYFSTTQQLRMSTENKYYLMTNTLCWKFWTLLALNNSLL
jgi:hypothetical protein